MTHAIHIIARLGGTRAAARLLEMPPSTVQSWKGAGVIPARYLGLILQKARQAGIVMQPAEMIDPAFLSLAVASRALVATTSAVGQP